MKNKTMLFGILAGLLFLACGAGASDYTVALSTYVPTASAGDFTLGSYPNISGNLYVRDMWISNKGATAQDISIYDTCTSSTAATLAGVVSVPASIGFTRVSDILPRVLKLSSPCFNKSATGSVVQFTILYE